MAKISNDIKLIAKKIVTQLDNIDGQDNKINADTWKKYAVAKYGAKNNVSVFIDIASAEKSIAYYIGRQSKLSAKNANDIGERWFNELANIKSDNIKSNNNINTKCNSLPQIVCEKDATYIDNNILEFLNRGYNKEKTKGILKSQNNINKDIIATKMHKKWASNFKNSNLSIDFYKKLYSVIKQINCEIDDSKLNKDKYSSKEEQTMDEVIAVLAGESSLNSKAKYYIYRGIFQLAAEPLETLKKIGKENNITGINQNITISEYANLSGEQQLDYLLAQVIYGRNRSGLTKDEKISPEQLWAMIKLPAQGQKNSKLVQQKSRAINKIFNNNNIERGIA